MTGIPIYHYRRENAYEPFNASDLLSQVRPSGRRVMVVCGWLLEGGVIVTTIRQLALELILHETDLSVQQALDSLFIK